MPEIKPETPVRVTIEGRVDQSGDRWVHVRYVDCDGDEQWVHFLPWSAVEVIPEVKVGDKVTAENVGGLPLGTVVISAMGLAAQKRGKSEWHIAGCYHNDPLPQGCLHAIWAAKIIYLPTSA